VTAIKVPANIGPYELGREEKFRLFSERDFALFGESGDNCLISEFGCSISELLCEIIRDIILVLLSHLKYLLKTAAGQGRSGLHLTV
jgi:hypothetical protein